MELDVVSDLTEAEFVENYLKKNKPVVVKNSSFNPEKWKPEFFKKLLGDLPVQVYDALFELQEVSNLSSYLDTYFNSDKEYKNGVPYIRWYSKLKNVDYVWSDEAFAKLAKYWKKPDFLPSKNLVLPLHPEGKDPDPVTDYFPYRGILVAAKNARTRLHRDPFCSDAMVSMFHGEKEVALYHPSRTQELLKESEGRVKEFQHFKDVREADLKTLEHEPDYHGFVGPGDVVYIPHGWLHDVIVTQDSISITWNFIHEKGAHSYIDYLMDDPEKDSEFEVVKHFYSLSGQNFTKASEVIQQYNQYFAGIELAG